MFNSSAEFLSKQSPYCILTFVAALNALYPSMLLSWHSNTAAQAISDGFGQNFTIWMAILSSAYLLIKYPVAHLTKPNSPSNLTSKPSAVVILLVLLLLIPNATCSWLIAALASFGWWKSMPINSISRTAALLMMAVTLRDPLSLLGLNVFTEQLLSFDRLITQAMLNLSISGANHSNIVMGEQFNLVILTGCSSFTNISLALLLWLNLTIMIQKTTKTIDFIRIILLITLALLCNSLRLTLMSKSLPDYHYYHQGAGAEIFSYLSILLVLLCINWRKSYVKYNCITA